MTLQTESSIVFTTQQFWEARTGSTVATEDAREAVRNVRAYFDLLASWSGVACAPSAVSSGIVSAL
ncbi:MAG TPA: hypothetical protein QGH10_12550 [Armatimonadota bacterium]|nr:hypothetical protein [Armatimonadota bacterium]